MKVRVSPNFVTTLMAVALAVTTVLLPNSAGASWSLIWADEFDGTALDATRWTPDIGTGCPDLCGWGNAELQYYRAQNLAVGGGHLTITAKRENYGGAAFTSGKITSSGKFAVKYGRIAMRAKLPTGGGMWPAFWMMPQQSVYGGWASSGEIDIMESANGTTSVGGALHYGGSWPNNTSTSGSYSLGGANFADDFHVYAVEWEEDVIRWYVDDVLFMTRTSAQWFSSADPGNPRAPFDQDFFILLNLAVGGYYTGCTTPSCITADLPQEYVIDWVRVYEEIANSEPLVSITAPGMFVPAGDITLAATAFDVDGSVVSVEFSAGGNVIGVDTLPPYEVVWAGATDGCYQVTARAVDDLGGEGTDVLDLTVGAGCGQAAYVGAPHPIPGRIQTEDFDVGGASIAYRDSDPSNNGGQYRPSEGVDIEACADIGGGYNTGWTNPGEWMEYTVDVAASGTYFARARVASLEAGGAFALLVDGVEVASRVVVPATTGWQTWQTVETSVVLAAGQHVLRFAPTAGEFNVNWFEFARDVVANVPDAGVTGPVLHPCHPNPFNPATTLAFELPRSGTVTLAVYDASGRLVRRLLDRESVAAGRHEIAWNGRDEAGRLAATGVYLCRLEAGGVARSIRMTLVK